MDWKKLIVIFLYNTIKGWVMSFLKGFLAGLAISEDIIMAIIGYLITKYKREWAWFGEALIYGAVASIGATGGLAIGGLFTTPAGREATTAGKEAEEVVETA